MPFQDEIESWFQSKVAISTRPAPTGASTRSGWSLSASHALLPGVSVPVATSSLPTPESAPAEPSTFEPVTFIGTIADGSPASVLCHDPPVPSRSAPPCTT